MITADIERLLRDTIGMNADSVSGSVIQFALKQRMAATQIAEPAAYWRLVTESRHELQELINAVVIPETWFFRDREAFAAMVRHVRANRRPGQPIRILSLPCSTGEEPYSAAMAMFDAGFSRLDFRVEGIDVSTRNIAEAERAVFGRNSFRGEDLAFRGRFCEAVPGGYRPIAAVREQVTFRAANLFDVAVPVAPESYDIVFCRNLLIYFDRTRQERALGRLRQLLAPGGMLLVGPAESSLPTLCGFVSARMPMAFAFLKQSAETVLRPEAVPPPRAKLPPRRSAPAVTRPIQRRRDIAPHLDAATDPAKTSLAAIERAANAGQLNEAKAAAGQHIDRFGPTADVYYLLGLAHDAAGEPALAIENYRKTLYLAPDHRETLAHLALLLQRQGDVTSAKMMNNRLARIEKRSRAP
ncbi:methyltransferase domain-containing protein [Mesorhizobium sp. BR1-1-16]|uniref:CheR family methyltransferase n=1 Tax=Mesorhizobium sp. BR1-1-16 TaxID=2876653 RepID=UPI001CCAB4BA|nr:CheR family methyltransferase [Mesorhizobium sp. BR1-1-16]MBZ9935261.1 methyltransferase domain-containing protein [Mesorhizobium sp. BR1-1-16]